MSDRHGVQTVEFGREAPAQIPVAAWRINELAGDGRAALQAFLDVEPRLAPSGCDLVQEIRRGNPNQLEVLRVLASARLF